MAKSAKGAVCLPGGLTLKQEAFCQAFVQSGNADDAYRKVYDCSKDSKDGTIRKEAHKLLRLEHILKRLIELRSKSEQVAIYGLNEAMAEARAAYDLALATGTPSAMVAATQLRAKLAGILVEKREVTNTVKELPNDELDRRIREVAAKAGVAITPVGEGSPVKH